MQYIPQKIIPLLHKFHHHSLWYVSDKTLWVSISGSEREENYVDLYIFHMISGKKSVSSLTLINLRGQ